jgi:peptidoglycan biosynthesis protein MviN/MurJ (putative lipid II flippase)
MVIGAFVHGEWMANIVRVRRFDLWPHWHGIDEATREVAVQFGPLVLSAAVASGGLLVDQEMAAMLRPGAFRL